MAHNPRALAIYDAFVGKTRGHAVTRGLQRLVFDDLPTIILDKKGQAWGVEVYVRLFEGLREIPIDGHRRFGNPPTVPRANLTYEEGVTGDDGAFIGTGRIMAQKTAMEGVAYRRIVGAPDPFAALIEMVWDSVISVPNARGFRTRGTVTTVFATAPVGQGYVRSRSSSYATARTGGSLAAFNNHQAGQAFSSPDYDCYESFLIFGTSGIPDADDVSAVVLSCDGSLDGSTTDFIMGAAASVYDGGSVVVGDWVSGDSIPTPELATWDSAGYSADYNAFTETAGFKDAINKTGDTSLILYSQRHRDATTPTGAERVIFTDADAAGTTTDPKLDITHAAGGPTQVSLAGNQPASSGSLGLSGQIALAGAQPAASGALSLSGQIALAGAQPASSGLLSLAATIALAGNQPAPSGLLSLLARIALTGAQPASSGALSSLRTVILAGVQPAASGVLATLRARALAGAQPASTGTLAPLFLVTLAGAQPAPSGALGAILYRIILAGNQPAATGVLGLSAAIALEGFQRAPSGTLDPVALFTLAGDWPASSGEIAALVHQALAGNQPAPFGALGLSAAIALAGAQPAPSGLLGVTYLIALAGNQPASSGEIVPVFVVALAGEQPASSGVLTIVTFYRVHGSPELRMGGELRPAGGALKQGQPALRIVSSDLKLGSSELRRGDDLRL